MPRARRIELLGDLLSSCIKYHKFQADVARWTAQLADFRSRVGKIRSDRFWFSSIDASVPGSFPGLGKAVAVFDPALAEAVGGLHRRVDAWEVRMVEAVRDAENLAADMKARM